MSKADADEYALLMESSAQLMDSLRVSIGQVQEILLKMAQLLRGLPSSEMYARTQAKMDEFRNAGIGEGENDDQP
jgi:hypothetical protein